MAKYNSWLADISMVNTMSDALGTLSAAVIVVMFLIALGALTVGETLLAGLLFLVTSLVVYFRETQL